MMGVSLELAAGWLVFSLVATLVTRLIIVLLRRAEMQTSTLGFLAEAGSGLLWALLMTISGVLASRYIERVENTLLAYLSAGILLIAFSLLRASLCQPRSPTLPADFSPALMNYMLLAVNLFLLHALLVDSPADPLMIIPLFAGALLPALKARRLNVARRWVRGWGHTLAANLLVAALTSPLIGVVGLRAWSAFSLGYLAHLGLDLLRPVGIMLLWPVSDTRYTLTGWLRGKKQERIVFATLVSVLVIQSFFVRWGPPRVSVPAITYDQALEQYYALRGRQLVWADITGSWQASGHPVAARFEILNAQGRSFILQDRFTGDVFSAGKSGQENVYVRSMRLAPGATIQIKPVELQLERDTRLSSVLPLVYEMQDEPGLEHIFVFGDLILPDAAAGLTPDHSQTRIQRIQKVSDEHYRLDYLSAAALVELAPVQVNGANLLIVATYRSPATGPTATPLPSPVPSIEVQP